MTPELRPLTGVVTYKVQDPKGNVILLKSDVILTKGVASGELFLNRNAMEGEYTISFDYKVSKSLNFQAKLHNRLKDVLSDASKAQ